MKSKFRFLQKSKCSENEQKPLATRWSSLSTGHMSALPSQMGSELSRALHKVGKENSPSLLRLGTPMLLEQKG